MPNDQDLSTSIDDKGLPQALSEDKDPRRLTAALDALLNHIKTKAVGLAELRVDTRQRLLSLQVSWNNCYNLDISMFQEEVNE